MTVKSNETIRIDKWLWFARFFKNRNLKRILESSFETDIAIVNEKVYNTSRANVFLAKYFLHEIL